MSFKKVFWGAVLILIGVLIILRNVGTISFTWWSLLRLWPLILVLWGISLIPMKEWIKLLASFLILIFAFFMITRDNQARYPGFRWLGKPFHQWNWNDEDWEKWQQKKHGQADISYQSLVEPYDSTITRAELQLDAAAGDFKIGDTTAHLIYFERKGREHKVNIKLHSAPVWDVDLDIGAAAVNMDMSSYRTKSIDIDGGAASIEMVLGDDYPETQVTIDAGASSITIRVPQESGCEVNANTVLSSRDLEGFHKIKDRTFQTDDFSASANKIFISIDAAVSSLSIVRY